MGHRISRLLDETASTLAGVLHRRSPPNPNTLHQLEQFHGHTPAELMPEPRLPERVDIRPRWRNAEFLCEDLSFASPHEPISDHFRRRHEAEYQANATVHVQWIRHLARPELPTLIYLHSWMQPDFKWEERNMLPGLARKLGMHVARMQLPYHGKRRPKGSLFHGEYFWTADLVRTIEAIRQTVVDARALIGWLDSTGQGPVGMSGASLGGMMTLTTACVEPKLAFAISIAAHLDLPSVMLEASLLTRFRRELATFGWGPEHVGDYLRELGFQELKPAIPKDRILLIAGKYDRILRPERLKALWTRWEEPHLAWFEGGHVEMFRYLRGPVREMRTFIDGLGLDANAASQGPVVRVASDAAARPASGEPGAVQAPDPDTKSLWA
ncbi:MAG: alpha/beta hydrolase family protein [Deltaproteobacteria bacterium]|nr:alpha/beta hydrolase family protein [Deltaproteobacteria bacterium]